MVIGIFGENCSGKSTLAEAIREAVGGTVISGKDYLRMAKSADEAEKRFRAMLTEAVHGESIIYVTSEAQQLALLPEGAVRILVQADLDAIKARFRARMHGVLPAPVEKMLERKHGMFDREPCDFRFDGVSGDAAALCEQLAKRCDIPQGLDNEEK